MVPEWLDEILQKQNYYNYHSFFEEFKHNHNSQAIVALAILGASKELVDKYVAALEKIIPHYKADEPLTEPREVDLIQSDNIDDYLGKFSGYYTILDKFVEMHKNDFNGDVNAMVKDLCPRTIDGIIGSSFHGTIQLAYGLAANCDSMVLEGIAYNFHGYFPLFFQDYTNPKRTDMSQFGHGQKDLLDILSSFRETDDFKDIQKMKKERNREEGEGYGWPSVTYHSDFIMDQANSVKLPEWFNLESKSMEQIEKLLDWVLDLSSVLYVKSNAVNDFILLHGITGSWSARKLIRMLDYDSALLGIRATIIGLMVAYAQEGAPALERAPEEFFTGEVNQGAWDGLISSVLQSEEFYEIHVYKVIHCLYERWQENQDSEYAKFYYAGACISRDHDYAFDFMSNKM